MMTQNGDVESDQGQVSIWRSVEVDEFEGPAGELLQNEIRAELAAAVQTFSAHPLFVGLELEVAGEQILAPAMSRVFARLARTIARLPPMQRDVVMRSLRGIDSGSDVLLARAWKVTTQAIRGCRERTLRRLAQQVQPPL